MLYKPLAPESFPPCPGSITIVFPFMLPLITLSTCGFGTFGVVLSVELFEPEFASLCEDEFEPGFFIVFETLELILPPIWYTVATVTFLKKLFVTAGTYVLFVIKIGALYNAAKGPAQTVSIKP